jgi:EAL domain-containing protein (putative c-di-GMP-specific phosphodiesterase class I)
MGSSEAFQFKLEPFRDLRKNIGEDNFPRGEILFRHPTIPTEDFFAAARKNPDTIVPTDLEIFEQAIAEHMRLGHSVSINLNAETFFDDRLLDTLNTIKHNHPDFRPQDIWLEITEHGGIPKNFDGSRLVILKELGFALALDDFDPTKDDEWERLQIFLPYIDAVKLPYQFMEDIRHNDIMATSRLIQKSQIACLGKIMIIEGHRGNDHEYNLFLQSVGIDVIQESGFGKDNLAPKL